MTTLTILGTAWRQAFLPLLELKTTLKSNSLEEDSKQKEGGSSQHTSLRNSLPQEVVAATSLDGLERGLETTWRRHLSMATRHNGYAPPRG